MSTLPEPDQNQPKAARPANRKPVIGLSGGIGAGKSTVAGLLRQHGATVIDSDELNRQVLAEPEVLATIRNWLGDRVLSADGAVDRRRLANVVFADAAQRERLEQYLHPRIGRRRRALQAQCQADPQVTAVVLDSPLLYEAQVDAECDCVIFVEADSPTRCERLGATRGWSGEEVTRREKVQKGLDFKRARADYIIRNNYSMDVLSRQVDELLSQIISSVKES